MNDTFHCVRCGACCRWEGPVRVTEKEVDEIAGFLGIPVKDFIRDHTVLTPDRRSLSLKENPDGSCRYYDPATRLCRIQQVKPKQCRDFPRVWNFPGWEKLCAGAQTEQPEYPVYRGPVKLMAALVLIFGSVPFLTAVKVIPLCRGMLSPEGFCRWWGAWLENGLGYALIGFPLATAVLTLILILGKMTRKTRFELWAAAAGVAALSAIFLCRGFLVAVQFEALLLSLGGAALWLNRKKDPAKNDPAPLDK